jgi:hypothetical protein
MTLRRRDRPHACEDSWWSSTTTTRRLMPAPQLAVTVCAVGDQDGTSPSRRASEEAAMLLKRLLETEVERTHASG